MICDIASSVGVCVGVREMWHGRMALYQERHLLQAASHFVRLLHLAVFRCCDKRKMLVVVQTGNLSTDRWHAWRTNIRTRHRLKDE